MCKFKLTIPSYMQSNWNNNGKYLTKEEWVNCTNMRPHRHFTRLFLRFSRFSPQRFDKIAVLKPPKAPPIDHTLLKNEYNCSVFLTPRKHKNSAKINKPHCKTNRYIPRYVQNQIMSRRRSFIPHA